MENSVEGAAEAENDVGRTTTDDCDDVKMHHHGPVSSSGRKSDAEKIQDMEDKARRIEDSVRAHAEMRRQHDENQSKSHSSKRKKHNRIVEGAEGCGECCAECCSGCECAIS
jgi:hypothetical protein